MKRTNGILSLLLICSSAMAGDAFLAGDVDFTKGYKPPADAGGYSLHWSVFSGIPNGSQKFGRDGNQIYVRCSAKAPPPAGLLKDGDVILGVNGKLFGGDVIETWRTSLQDAKTYSEDGTLGVIRWRDGKQETLSMLVVVPPPDLTRGETENVNRKETYNLGSTGLRGWIYTSPRSSLDARQGRTTSSSRQIMVTHVGVNSPADGVLQPDDVILGVGGKLFSDDARQCIGRAITEAEMNRNKGVLKLTRWRAGKTDEVHLTLNVMGRYSKKAPYDCPKSTKILDEACAVLAKEPLHDNLWGAVNGLALMASGKAEYLPKVQAFARSMAAAERTREGGGAWDCGYKGVFLCEYYLLTGDEEVMPGIKALTIKMARGQGMYGTFGHGFSDKTADGGLHGSIPPYGPVNQAGLIANLGIVLGKKCGVTDPEIDPAIERACSFFSYFVDKGGIPYGEHEPFPMHENNGKNSLAALLFSIQGDRTEAAKFFAKMSTAAYANRETGHTGQGFSYLWSALGANIGGPAAAAAFFKEAQWHLDLVRRCDGSFTYDGAEQHGPGRTDDDTYYGNSSYSGLSPAATYVLTYSMPLKKLYITGKDAKKSAWLSRKDIAQAIRSGRFDIDRKVLTAHELVEAFSDWSPMVRSWAAEELARRPEAASMVPALIAIAEGKDAHARQGACEALGYIKSTDALPVLVRLLKDDDRYLRVKAAKALRNTGDLAQPVLTDMLQAVVDTAEPIDPIVWADPIQLTHGHLAAALFDGMLRSSIDGVDKKLLYPAIRAVAGNADGMARSYLVDTFAGNLTLEDVQALEPEIFTAIRETAPADTMFGNELRMASAAVLSKYHYREGLQAIIDYVNDMHYHGSQVRVPELMTMLASYGAAGREILPDLRALIVEYKLPHPHANLQKIKVAAVEETIRIIETDENPPELRSFEK